MIEREKVIRGLERCAGIDCTGCPYQRISPCQNKLVADALALLREQEPRVLALEKILSGTVEVAWLECSDKEEVRAGLWFKRINEGEDEGIIIHVLDGFEGLRTGVYGKTWRCWTARPTEEQRKAAKWDPPKEAGHAKDGPDKAD